MQEREYIEEEVGSLQLHEPGVDASSDTVSNAGGDHVSSRTSSHYNGCYSTGAPNSHVHSIFCAFV
jgi:hypothetical protein